MMRIFFVCSNKEKGKVKRQKVVKKKGFFIDFQEDLIKDLFKMYVFFFIGILDVFFCYFFYLIQNLNVSVVFFGYIW